MLVIGAYVTNHSNDGRELAPAVASVAAEVREISDVSVDTGFYSEEGIRTVEREGQGPTVYCPVEKQSHHRKVEDLLPRPEKPPDGTEPMGKERMRERLKSAEGKAIYKKRKETVEPVFGIIKTVLGFRQFMLRGMEKVNSEWELVVSAYNLKRLHRLSFPSVMFGRAVLS
jgi:hypothetical protein